MQTPPAHTPITALNLLKIMKCTRQAYAWAQIQASVRLNGAKDKGLTGLCAHVAAELQDNLRDQGLSSVIHVLEDRQADVHHCYVEVGTLVIDVTASQFRSDIEPIVIIDRKKINVRKTPWWAIGVSIEDRSELIQYLFARGWPADQIPRKARALL